MERLVINPNTVLKAYRELEHEGLIVSRPGQGTFILRTLTPMSPKYYTVLRCNEDKPRCFRQVLSAVTFL